MSHRPYYELTFEEVEALAAQGETIVSACGYLICSRDRKFDAKYARYIWEGEKHNAIATGRIPPDPAKPNIKPHIKPESDKDPIRIQREAHAAKEANIDTRPLNKKGRPFSWSYSALNDFDGDLGCPLKYAHARYYCTTPYVETEAQAWGNAVHKSGEIFVQDGTIDNPESFKPVEKYAQLFRSLKEKGAEIIPELEIVLDQNMKPLTGKKAWFSKDAWFRIKIDVPIIQGTKCSIFDYKTGGTIRDSYEQLHLSMASVGHVRPELETFSGKLIWTKFQETTGCPDLDRAGVSKVWENVLPRVKRMEAAWRSENFSARPNGLCKKYCEVTSCPHNGRH